MALGLASFLFLAGSLTTVAMAQQPAQPADGAAKPAESAAKPASEQDGKYFDADGAPTFNIKPDGTVDWYTYSGFRRYHAECHVCHGPDGAGSTYAPALAESLKTMTYEQFTEVVVQGRQNVNTGSENVMPAFGTNKNVMCYLDDIYVYLKARAVGGLARGRPAKHDDKPPSAREAEDACLGG
ncbi:c-type cytochrome, methanol metabolism-related [Chelatococcus sp. GCM10030263]|uniref:c-type cytochrome, methanol metabolism-related n=1 Tax=Chelatococcus sp. GCM10030263 TaxID=3273387 RepID=UPI00362441D4